MGVFYWGGGDLPNMSFSYVDSLLYSNPQKPQTRFFSKPKFCSDVRIRFGIGLIISNQKPTLRRCRLWITELILLYKTCQIVCRFQKTTQCIDSVLHSDFWVQNLHERKIGTSRSSENFVSSKHISLLCRVTSICVMCSVKRRVSSKAAAMESFFNRTAKYSCCAEHTWS